MAYCFAEKKDINLEATGNGNADGPFVTQDLNQLGLW